MHALLAVVLTVTVLVHGKPNVTRHVLPERYESLEGKACFEAAGKVSAKLRRLARPTTKGATLVRCEPVPDFPI